ncbi:FMN phosphatase YigB (HAD superfamily) [Phyllobacterium ifriqiyense]|uniref:FMN phosphatase YigB (HAD superfamily) n=2 Tax=Phyllobacterium ifriqiyense TaxID=314238 RepID=A0ABU0S7Z2_9HYPH|nr:FMN phosphatase YigB (HAD superfamily) [Phyllobacterium ifriqiyense]
MPHSMLIATANRREGTVSTQVVCLDADNTLWDTDGVFAVAQLQLLTGIAKALQKNVGAPDRLAYVREVDQELASRHHLGLRYPPRLLIAALCHRLDGSDPATAARTAWSDPTAIPLSDDAVAAIESRYFSDLRSTPKLLPGVPEGLEKMHRAGATLVIVTEGGRQRVQNVLRANNIDGYIDRVIDAPKRKELFIRLKRLFGPAVQVFMIGDQITRDIIPAAAAGIEAIHVEGKFRPIWEIGSDASISHKAATFESAADTVLASA